MFGDYYGIAANESPAETWSIVNGSLLPQHIGKRVSCIGTVVGSGAETKRNASVFELMTPDKLTITVSLKKPQTLQPDMNIEVHGIAQSRNSILVDRIIPLPTTAAAGGGGNEIDCVAYNNLVTFFSVLPDVWAIE